MRSTSSDEPPVPPLLGNTPKALAVLFLGNAALLTGIVTFREFQATGLSMTSGLSALFSFCWAFLAYEHLRR